MVCLRRKDVFWLANSGPPFCCVQELFTATAPPKTAKKAVFKWHFPVLSRFWASCTPFLPSFTSHQGFLVIFSVVDGNYLPFDQCTATQLHKSSVLFWRTTVRWNLTSKITFYTGSWAHRKENNPVRSAQTITSTVPRAENNLKCKKDSQPNALKQ